MVDFISSLDFIVKAIIAGIGIAVVAGPLGSLIVWRRMSYFGDTLAHSTLTGICLALLLNLNIYIGLIVICLFVATALGFFSKQKRVAVDAILGMLSHTALAVGLILATYLDGVRVDLLGYLYGDILAVSTEDILWVAVIDIVVLALLGFLWRHLLAITVQEDLARVEGVPVDLVRWCLIIIMALVFAVAMKLVGVLLITALLVIPASAARQISKTPEQMALIASVLGVVAVIGGIMASLHLDWPTGPAIVVTATVIFLLSFSTNMVRRKNLY